MKREKISELTTNRLCVYLRCLNELADRGQTTVSSQALAKQFHFNSAQIRKDLASFGEFGIRGVGYYIDSLRENLAEILGLNRQYRLCIIGAGRLGSALADYYSLRGGNFEVAAFFDSDPAKIGSKIGGFEVFDVKNFSQAVKKDNIEVAVIAVPAEHAQQVLQQVMDAGIKAVMNFAPVPLKAAEGVKVRTVDLTTSLESLSYFLAQPARPGGPGHENDGRRHRKE